jgi:hypothetical protein
VVDQSRQGCVPNPFQFVPPRFSSVNPTFAVVLFRILARLQRSFKHVSRKRKVKAIQQRLILISVLGNLVPFQSLNRLYLLVKTSKVNLMVLLLSCRPADPNLRTITFRNVDFRVLGKVKVQHSTVIREFGLVPIALFSNVVAILEYIIRDPPFVLLRFAIYILTTFLHLVEFYTH